MATVPDMTGWTEVTAADGKVLGWMAAPDPDEPDVDYFEADQRRRAACRAAAVGQLVDALACESLDVITVCEASGLPESGVDAATYLALVLRQAELSAED